jgi:hypothetical protein
LPFHPLELGEEALRGLAGFTIEGGLEPDDVDASAVPLLGFGVTDPTGREKADRDAIQAALRARMGSPRFYRPGPDGTMIEIASPFF